MTEQELIERRETIERLVKTARELRTKDPMRGLLERSLIRCLEHEDAGDHEKTDNLLAIVISAAVLIMIRETATEIARRMAN